MLVRSKLANWRKEYEHRLDVSSSEIEYPKVKPKPAARLCIENVDMTVEFHSPLYHNVIIATTLTR